MKNFMNVNAINQKNLNTDTTNIALMFIAEELSELERLYKLADSRTDKLSIMIKHSELLDLYKREIENVEDLDLFKAP